MTSSLPSERAQDALRHIRDNILLAQDFCRGVTLEAFADPRAHYGVVRCLEIISEASRRLLPEQLARHPTIAWRAIAAAGNIYRHVYDGLDLRDVWNTVHEDLPPLLTAVEAELARGMTG